MKLLESSRFEAINSALFVETGEAKIVGRIESYSCKMIGSDKQFYKKFSSESGHGPNHLEALSPPINGYGGYSLSPQQSYMRSYSSCKSSDEDEACSGGGGGGGELRLDRARSAPAGPGAREKASCATPSAERRFSISSPHSTLPSKTTTSLTQRAESSSRSQV